MWCELDCIFSSVETLSRPWTSSLPRAPKKIEKKSLFFISVDEFSKLICCFLFSLIFSTNSTNQRNQRNEFNESTNKIFVDFTKFQRIFNEKFNESTKILKKSSNSLKFCSKLVDALKIAIDFSWFFESLVDLLESSLKIR